jgi:GT2 family glycosyltransferase
MACNVHHITPGRSDKNLGKAINDIIKLLPENDWVCIRDIDTYPTYHEKFFDTCESIANQGKFDLVGCLTNRLGLPWQCVTGMYDESDIRIHRSKGIELYQKNKDAVLQVNKNIAGLFFLFPKSTWVKVGGFKEGGIRIDGKYIDYQFSRAVQRLGLKTGIASGIYLFHWYRFDKDKKDTEHLF